MGSAYTIGASGYGTWPGAAYGYSQYGSYPVYDYSGSGVYYPGKLFFDQSTITIGKEVNEVKTVSHEVDLTQDDIDGGCRSKASNCPGALAINRALAPLGLYASVGAFNTALYDEPVPLNDFEDGRMPVHSFENPGALKMFVPNFDEGRIVYPIKFTIELPEGLGFHTVKLSRPEARTLQAILAKVGGSPTNSPRQHQETIRDKLHAAGVPSYSKLEEFELGTGSIMFSDYGTAAKKAVTFW